MSEDLTIKLRYSNLSFSRVLDATSNSEKGSMSVSFQRLKDFIRQNKEGEEKSLEDSEFQEKMDSDDNWMNP